MRLRIKVVLPEPRKPVIMVIGIGAIAGRGKRGRFRLAGVVVVMWETPGRYQKRRIQVRSPSSISDVVFRAHCQCKSFVIAYTAELNPALTSSRFIRVRLASSEAAEACERHGHKLYFPQNDIEALI